MMMQHIVDEIVTFLESKSDGVASTSSVRVYLNSLHPDLSNEDIDSILMYGDKEAKCFHWKRLTSNGHVIVDEVMLPSLEPIPENQNKNKLEDIMAKYSKPISIPPDKRKR